MTDVRLDWSRVTLEKNCCIKVTAFVFAAGTICMKFNETGRRNRGDNGMKKLWLGSVWLASAGLVALGMAAPASAADLAAKPYVKAP